MKSHIIRTERLIVRELPPSAAFKVAAFVKENWHFHRQWEPYRDDTYFTVKEQRRRLRHGRANNDAFHLWILDASSGRGNGWRDRSIIGSISVTGIFRGFFQNAFLGYKIDARHARRGYMYEALAAVVTYLFRTVGLHRIEANVMPGNTASLNLLRKLGFAEEGLARRYLQIQGRWEDHLHMVMLSDEWRPEL